MIGAVFSWVSQNQNQSISNLLANHKRHRPSYKHQNSKQIHVAGAMRGKTRAGKSRMALVFLLIGWGSGTSLFKPITKRSDAKPKQSWNYFQHSIDSWDERFDPKLSSTIVDYHASAVKRCMTGHHSLMIADLRSCEQSYSPTVLLTRGYYCTTNKHFWLIFSLFSGLGRDCWLLQSFWQSYSWARYFRWTTIINYHALGQTIKTVINYHKNFEHVQSE